MAYKNREGYLSCRDPPEKWGFLSLWVDEKIVVHLLSGILQSHTKGTPTFCKSMNIPRDYYAKWQKPIGVTQVP